MDTLKGKDTVEAMHGKMQLALLPFEGFTPHLAIIRVGENPADISYEKGAKKRMEKVGIRCSTYQFPGNITQKEFMEAFNFINSDEDVDGILLFRPLPKQLDEKLICQTIDPVKDVDCISPVNVAKVLSGDADGYAPCTAQAVVELLDNEKIDVTGKEVVIIGRSMVVGRPLSMMLLQKNATVTICHTKTVDVKAVCRRADIVVACAGRAKMVDSSYLKNDAVVIDVGINELDGKLCGDVDFDDIQDVASKATPVPGGVGMVTTSVLAKHVIEAATRRRDIEKVALRNGETDSYLN
ncbi:MAG: bifunctional 5,10-methylenetetrahydrofolate dehydrogenase/5,10-methenyltetrahydrofolate cyclohydrolase [Lachnospiraceae bacterium]|nr:bifunctional 5,10-methylenetetrahydrofolate dehydrogenase/5,10-methenyltetrahydrofolate cyclohydrolase [Lachnospiraceae bacterium]